MLQCVPYVGERLGAFLDLEREEPGLQVLHRAIELRAMLGLRISAGELERHRLRCAALRERIHHQLRAMTQKPALIKFRIATRLDAQAQERAHHVARDETRPARERLAVVNQPLRGQRVLDVPCHPDRVVMLQMLGDLRLALARNRLAQARKAEAGGKSGAESNLVDEGERALLARNPPLWGAPEMVIAMAFKRIEGRRCAGQVYFSSARFTHRAKMLR